MASPGQESAARPVVAATGRWGEYTQLSRQLRQAGLLERRRGWYGVRIGLNLALLAAGWVGFVVLGESWWQLVTAAYLAVVATQLAFVGHDAGHRQIFRSRWANDLVGLVHANVLVGVSFDWWVGKHNAHHTNPNHEDLDPDISITALAFTTDQARSRHGWSGCSPATRPGCSSPCCCWKRPTCTWPAARPSCGAQAGPTWSRGCCWWPMSPAPSRPCSWSSRRPRRWPSWWSNRGCSAVFGVRSRPTTRGCRP